MKFIILCCAIVPFLHGCIAWEIRDEIRATNRHLCEVKPSLIVTNEKVEETNQLILATEARLTLLQAELIKTQQQLTDVQASLTKTNPTLADLDAELERLRVLNDVQLSLVEVNKSLSPLGKAMSSLGGAMSLIGLGESSSDLLAESPAETSAETAPSPDAAVEAPGRKRPDPILGTWIAVYPPPASGNTLGPIIILSEGGAMVFAEQGKPTRSGKWARQSRSLTFTPDAVANEPAPRADAMEVLTLNSRTLTVRSGDSIRVYTRP